MARVAQTVFYAVPAASSVALQPSGRIGSSPYEYAVDPGSTALRLPATIPVLCVFFSVRGRCLVP